MEQPQGFVHQGGEHLVCKLHKSLYGLKQSPRAWNQKFDTFLKSVEFMKSEADPSVYVTRVGDVKLSLWSMWMTSFWCAMIKTNFCTSKRN
jgi:hypothetical protein